MTTDQDSNQAEAKILSSIGITTKSNALVQMDALLSFFVDLAGAFPEEAKKIDVRRWGQISVYGGDKLEGHLDSRLVHRLHSLSCHPDWEYVGAVTNTRLNPADVVSHPPGVGWVKNTHIDDGVSQDGEQYTFHFMRLKSDALKDDVNVSSLPPVRQEKMFLSEYLGLLREKFNKGYMPSATSAREFNSKPEYVTTVAEIVSQYRGNDVYSLADRFDVRDHASLKMLEQQLGKDFFYDTNRSHLIYSVEISGFRIVTNLSDDRTFVTVQRKDLTWQNWVQWDESLQLPINRLDLSPILENI